MIMHVSNESEKEEDGPRSKQHVSLCTAIDSRKAKEYCGSLTDNNNMSERIAVKNNTNTNKHHSRCNMRAYVYMERGAFDASSFICIVHKRSKILNSFRELYRSWSLATEAGSTQRQEISGKVRGEVVYCTVQHIHGQQRIQYLHVCVLEA